MIRDMFKKLVKQWYDMYMNDQIECDEEQMEALMGLMAHQPVSRDMVVNEILHVSPSTFNEWVKMGKMPEGRKRRGWKELVWYRDEVLEARKKMKENK